MVIVATDLPATSRLLARLARRAMVGVVRTGSFMSSTSGDFVIAFTTSNRLTETGGTVMSFECLDEQNPIVNEAFRAVADSTEEAILNSVTQATPMWGRDDHFVDALSVEIISDAMRKSKATS